MQPSLWEKLKSLGVHYMGESCHNQELSINADSSLHGVLLVSVCSWQTCGKAQLRLLFQPVETQLFREADDLLDCIHFLLWLEPVFLLSCLPVKQNVKFRDLLMTILNFFLYVMRCLTSENKSIYRVYISWSKYEIYGGIWFKKMKKIFCDFF